MQKKKAAGIGGIGAGIGAVATIAVVFTPLAGTPKVIVAVTAIVAAVVGAWFYVAAAQIRAADGTRLPFSQLNGQLAMVWICLFLALTAARELLPEGLWANVTWALTFPLAILLLLASGTATAQLKGHTERTDN